MFHFKLRHNHFRGGDVAKICSVKDYLLYLHSSTNRTTHYSILVTNFPSEKIRQGNSLALTQMLSQISVICKKPLGGVISSKLGSQLPCFSCFIIIIIIRGH